MQVVVVWQLNPNETSRLIGELSGQRLVVPEAVEDGAVVAIDGRPTAAIIGQADLEPGSALGAFGAVPDDHPGERLGSAQINLPPGLSLLLRVESRTTVLHAIAAAGGILIEPKRQLIG